MQPHIQVIDNGQVLTITMADILKYHGGLLPGGCAHAFQAMRAGFTLLADEPLQRREIYVQTAFAGPGGRDTVEFVTRAYTGERATYNRALGTPDLFTELPGSYVWLFSYRGKTVRVQIAGGWVKPEFVALGQKTNRTVEENAHLVYLRQEMADRLLAADPREIYVAQQI